MPRPRRRVVPSTARLLGALVAVGASCAAATALAAAYRYKDEQGTWVYTDRPPVRGSAESVALTAGATGAGPRMVVVPRSTAAGIALVAVNPCKCTVEFAVKAATVAGTLVGRKVALTQKVWAAVNVRTPRVHDRAALVFHDADVVDPQSGMARWSAGLFGEWTGLMQLPEDGLGGLTAPPPVAHGMDVWIHADASHDYMVVCRVRLKSAKGDVVVRSDGGFELTTHVDHTGKSFGKVSWLVDPPVDGWYSFSIGTKDAWSTPGCWIDEI